MRRRRALAALILASSCESATVEDPSAAITPLPLPAIELETRDGRGASLEGLDGPLLLHFWATWCAPCRRELPGLLQLAGELDGVRVVAVTDEPWSAVRRHFAPREVPRWIARDRGGVLARTLGVRSLPETYVVEAGVARRRVAGALDWTRPAIRAWAASLPRSARQRRAGATLDHRPDGRYRMRR